MRGKESRARADGAREAKVCAVALGMDIRVVSSGEGEGLEVLRAWGRDLKTEEDTSRGEWKQGGTSGLAGPRAASGGWEILGKVCVCTKEKSSDTWRNL